DRLLDLGAGNEVIQYSRLNSFAWRLLLWKSSMEWMSVANSVFGYGLNSFKQFSPIFFQLAGTTNFGAHNTYIQWFFETGIIGVISAAWMHVWLFVSLKLGVAYDKLRSSLAILMLIAYLFFAFSDNMLDYLSFNWYFWFFIGAACAIAVVNKKDADAEAAAEMEQGGGARSQSVHDSFTSNRGTSHTVLHRGVY